MPAQVYTSFTNGIAGTNPLTESRVTVENRVIIAPLQRHHNATPLRTGIEPIAARTPPHRIAWQRPFQSFTSYRNDQSHLFANFSMAGTCRAGHAH